MNAQYVTTAPNFYTEQELVETVLFGDTECVENILITNTSGGSFSNTKSFGFFESNNSGFPFESGLVLSTGRLNNVDGPNDNLSDDGNDDNWVGDSDLENAVGLSPGETTNATVFEFQFTPKATNLSFRYIFASEEYQEGDPNTCIYSDAFAFLIKPANTQAQFENIAVIPGTNEPVLVTSVHPEIPGNNGCPAENEEYFGQFNNTNAPINFNGRTAVLTANANVIANQTYDIKLVIADETNYRYDSAVFIEANSFNIGADLGQDLTGNNALCEGDVFTLSLPEEQAGNNITWFYEGTEISQNENSLDLEISQAGFGAGTYRVNVELANGCSATDSIEVEFINPNNYDDLNITQCQAEIGLTQFNLDLVLAEINELNLISNGFYTSLNEAILLQNPILNTQNFEVATNTQLYVAVQNEAGCQTVLNLNLNINPTTLPSLEVQTCRNENNEIVFSINDLISRIENNSNIPNNTSISLFNTQTDAANNLNEILETELSFPENSSNSIFARFQNSYNCSATLEVILSSAQVPELSETQSESFLCLNEASQVELVPSLQNTTGNFNYNWSTGATTSTILVDESGSYTVEISNPQSLSECFVTQNFNVLVSESASISYNLTGTPENFQVEIIAEGAGEYEYALNTSAFKDSNFFEVSAAQNTIFVRDKNGCGLTSVEFQVIDFPQFFTPNNDGYNDVWAVKGPQEQRNQIKFIQIFDRYGKHIARLDSSNLSWNGTFNGNLLPSGDYWYVVEFEDGQTYTHHFTLKR
ncbi:T9SS type B sorting domain-containing protein [Psychroflexus sp. ALD_RP9]|uniref:T9SS type B sorting domain-containing protein n=1 Tax=Psychroflexus sp. ALD_RP9 TaxID=2777186 RepID=UPI001A8F6373|nr:choice-of-anchor L domain-containing protein [Psychroflexus sp. ALD_RP9]QSS96975.1 T9SS type B sorting domain-containing protein [Psychroflexus sp. ALD_RP9]